MFSQVYEFCQSHKRLIAALMLIALGALHVPVTTTNSIVARHQKTDSLPFPCQNSPCGCANAVQCYTSCCCHPLAERVQFGKKHGVDITQFGLAPHDDAVVVEREIGVKQRVCCVAKATRSTESIACNAAIPDASLRITEAGSNPETDEHEDLNSDSNTVVKGKPHLIAIHALLACKGLQAFMSLIAACVVPTTKSPLLPSRNAEQIILLKDENCVSPSFAPDVPPPRRV